MAMTKSAIDRVTEWLEQHPLNQPGADKTHVEAAMVEFQQHYRRISGKRLPAGGE